MKMYRNDLKPDLRILLTDDDAPLDLTTANAIKVIGVRGGVEVFNRSAVGDANGVVTMQWQIGDTASTGRIKVEVEVTWPDGKPQTFRPDSSVLVETDLG